LIFLGVQQNRFALATRVIDRVLACLKHGRGLQDMADWWSGNDFEADLTNGHRRLRAYRREHDHSQSPTPGRMTAVGNPFKLAFPRGAVCTADDTTEELPIEGLLSCWSHG
jgi:hypothetical protein